MMCMLLKTDCMSAREGCGNCRQHIIAHLFPDVRASAVLLRLRAEAPHRVHRLLLRQLRLQAPVQPEVPLQRADGGAEHVGRRHCQEDKRVSLSPAGAGTGVKPAHEEWFTPHLIFKSGLGCLIYGTGAK